ncbi:MAG: hypothetical protein JWO03_1801 [Bacteroidetes bacterium]|nr:hypothetical protein [Bacteroidota bacterium]
MKKINTIITLTILVLSVNFATAKTYVAINSGKWSDASTWENGAPGNEIAATDEVIVKNHITMNTDVAVKGTLTIEKGKTVMSNKSLFIANGGKVNNNGNLTVKRIVNEGTINNNSMIESMNDMENKGTITNNQNLVAGTNLLNFGGNIEGNKGTYFANGTVVASNNAKFGNNIKIYANPSQTGEAAADLSSEVDGDK